MTEINPKLTALASQFNFLLRFANDIILLMDESGNILDANDIAVQTYSWSLNELLTLNIKELRDPSTLGEITQQLKLTADTGALFETRHKCRDGSIFPVEVSSRLFEHEGKKYRQSIVRDITARRAMQTKLELNTKRVNGLLKLNEIANTLSEKEFMQAGLQSVEDLTASKIAFIHFVNDDQETIELVAWSKAKREASGCSAPNFFRNSMPFISGIL